jgi:hypothetical protein
VLTTIAPAEPASCASSLMESPTACFSPVPLEITASSRARSGSGRVEIVFLVINYLLRFTIIMSSYFLGINRLLLCHPDSLDSPFTSKESGIVRESLT